MAWFAVWRIDLARTTTLCWCPLCGRNGHGLRGHVHTGAHLDVLRGTGITADCSTAIQRLSDWDLAHMTRFSVGWVQPDGSVRTIVGCSRR